jgi:nucleoside-diphosphate-sugar epimerase
MTMDPDPVKVISPMIAGTLNLLNAAAKQPAVKRFVLTSSCAAAASPQPGVARTIDTATWNTEASREAWAPPPYAAERGFAVYAASKMEMERGAWTWHGQHNPHFVLNTGQSVVRQLSSVLLLIVTGHG